MDKSSSVEPNPSTSKSSICRHPVKIRKYNSDYFEIGFTYTGSEHDLNLNVLFATKTSLMSV